MTRVYVLCEGQSEESFCGGLLAPMLQSKHIILIPIICLTKRSKDGKKHRGGASAYGKIRNELLTLCRQHPHEFVTMMFDYYRLPNDTPGISSIPGDSAIDKVQYLEERVGQDIGSRNFIPNIVLHEFEGLLFSSPDAFAYCGLSENNIRKLQHIRDNHDSPEHIDDGASTAPSKRILAIHPRYNKVLDGTAIALDIGLEKILGECRHFSAWVKKIEGLRDFTPRTTQSIPTDQ